jgi:hypothetical protein
VSDHLKQFQFKPGQTGNPGGRPKGLERTAREALALRVYQAKDGKTYTGDEAALQCLLDMGFDDKHNARERIAAFKEVFDRGHGKAKQAVNVTRDAAAVATMPRDPAEMTDTEVREALAAIGTLKRLAVVGGDTEH